jgi:dihydropteroate synthase
MGIVNVTPDSFSDGGKWFDPSVAVAHALQLVEQGAEIIDVGGESTRPNSQPVDQAEELRRVIPVVAAIARQTRVPISIDTSKSVVAAEALAAGAEIINDVTGLQGDPQMLRIARDSGAAICVMHMQGTPQTMQDDPNYDDVVHDVIEYLRRRRMSLVESGIRPDQICLDPGIGFGKSHGHNLRLVAEISHFHALESPLLVGHSRKGFIGKLLNIPDADRDAGTLGLSLFLALQRVQILRVHEVRQTRQALLTFSALLAVK